MTKGYTHDARLLQQKEARAAGKSGAEPVFADRNGEDVEQMKTHVRRGTLLVPW